MDAKLIKDILSINDIADLLNELGGEPIIRGNEIFSRTICHNGRKKKLIYFDQTKLFHCFTDCSCSYDLFALVGKVFNLDFPSTVRYICGKFGIKYDGNFVVDSSERIDTSFINKFKKKEYQFLLNEIDKSLLNSYYQLYHEDWINDGISIETMRKFGILFSIKENKIIIPHFDVNNRLLGIRGRALNQEEVDNGKKYMPVYLKGEVRKHPTGANIYGLNITKDLIQKYKTIILFESEKSPMQLNTMIPEMSIGGGVSGSSLSFEQIKIMKDLGVENVVLGLDKEFNEVGSNEEKFYKQKVYSGFISKLLPYFHVSIIWDKDGLLDYKDSPTDKGVDIFKELWEKRLFLGSQL